MTLAAPFEITLSPPLPGDLDNTRPWLLDALAGTGLEAMLPCDTHGDDDWKANSHALVARTGDEVVGVVLYERVAGTVSCGTILLVGVAPSHRGVGNGAALVSAAVADLGARGASTIVVELPDEERLSGSRSLLRAQGFLEEGTVPDYYRDGIALVIMRRVTT